MNVKKAVYDRIINILQNELISCNNNIFNNKQKFKRLAEEQTILKRERAKIQKITNEVTE
jgi:hypothetical protein